MTTTQPHKLTTRQHFRAVKVALFLLNHKHELERLIMWAANKRRKTRARHFAYIGEIYKERHHVAEQKLLLVRARHPRHFWLAWVLHQVSNFVSVKPGYHRGLSSGRR